MNSIVFYMHNLDQSGANQVILNIIQGGICLPSQIVVVSPKVGPFESKLKTAGVCLKVGKPLKDAISDLSREGGERREITCVIANTIMTADVIVEHQGSTNSVPIFWLIHEWWDDELLSSSIQIRNMNSLTIETVKLAFKQASKVIFVCDSQKRFYMKDIVPGLNNTTVIHCGSPDSSLIRQSSSSNTAKSPSCSAKFATAASSSSPSSSSTNVGLKPFIFLCVGIICPRKNQLEIVKLFQQFMKMNPGAMAKLLIVGARYSRKYEIEYLEEIKEQIKKGGNHDVHNNDDFNNDSIDNGIADIQIYDVTDNVDKFYESADCLLMLSTNEVTPLVILEAMSHSIPIIATNIAGVPEMVNHGEEGFLIPPSDNWHNCLAHMARLFDSPDLRREMGQRGRIRFLHQFELKVMVDKYRSLLLAHGVAIGAQLVRQQAGDNGDADEYGYSCGSNRCGEQRLHSSPLPSLLSTLFHSSGRKIEILIDMDNTIANWDGLFFKNFKIWDEMGLLRHIDRSKSFFIEDCLIDSYIPGSGNGNDSGVNESKYDADENEATASKLPIGLFKAACQKIYCQEGFFEMLEPNEGAIDCLFEMEALGYDVKIVTSPILTSKFCVQEKLNWVKKHLGERWLERVVITSDKTRVIGDILIDDKPYPSIVDCDNELTARPAIWTQVLFDMPYNYHMKDYPFRLGNWTDWRKVVESTLNFQDTRRLSSKLAISKSSLSSDPSRCSSLTSLNLSTSSGSLEF